MLWDGKNVGSLPNMMWRAVSMEDLRLHPHFVGLPEPEQVTIESPMDYRKFRQGSKEWSLLHDGRLTTSRMAPILGIYEPTAQSKLGVPRSLSGHHKAMDAYLHLIRPPCDAAAPDSATWGDDVPDAEGEKENGGGSSGIPGTRGLFVGEPMSRGQRRRARGKDKAKSNMPVDLAAAAAAAAGGSAAAAAEEVWVHADASARFSHKYNPASKPEGPAWRVESAGHARMIWGNTQEPTSVLAAVNHFHKLAGAITHEVGVCPLEAVSSPVINSEGLPLIGASPDCFLVYPDGGVEALEVKNHAPFRAGGTTWKSQRRGAFAFSDGGPFNQIATWHVPQVQLEMLCLGPQCRATNFLSCSATKGITIVRVARDDSYIETMLKYARIFHKEYTLKGKAPPDNFAVDNYPDYLAFLEHTRRISNSAEITANIKALDVQRSPYNRRLFLD